MRLLFLGLPLLLLCSCVTGHNFNYDKTSSLDLHQLKSTEYAGLFGEPYKTYTKTTREGKYRQVWFHQSSKAFFGKVSRRNLILEFKDDQLNSFVYASSFDIDKTRVDLSKINQIKIGVSTKNELLTVMGKPYGKALCPSLLRDFKDRCANANEVWTWVEFDKTQSFGNIDPLDSKALFVMFDDGGKVTDLEATDNQ